MSGGEWFSEALALGLVDQWSAELEEANNACNAMKAGGDDAAEYVGAKLQQTGKEIDFDLMSYGKKMGDAINGTEAEIQKAKIRAEAQLKMVIVRGYAMLSQLMSMAGITIDPVFNAIIHLAFTTAEQYLVLAGGHTASMNVVGAALAMSSASISIGAAVKAQQEQQRSRAEMEANRAEMERAKGLGFSITFISD